MLEYFENELLFTPAEVIDLVTRELKPRMEALEKYYRQNEEQFSPNVVDGFKELFVDLAKEVFDELPLLNTGLDVKKPFDMYCTDDGTTYDVISDLSNRLRIMVDYCTEEPPDKFRSKEDMQECFNLFVRFAQAILNAGQRFCLIFKFPGAEMTKAFLGTGKYFYKEHVQ